MEKKANLQNPVNTSVSNVSGVQKFFDSGFSKILLTSLLLFFLFGTTFFVAYRTMQKRKPSIGEGIPTPVPTQGGMVRDGCVVGGCNGEICTDAGGNTASICIYRPEFQCYKAAVCAKQADGKCGWTQTDELKACLAKYQ